MRISSRDATNEPSVTGNVKYENCQKRQRGPQGWAWLTRDGGLRRKKRAELLCRNGMGEADQILGLHPNHASARAINVGNQKEGDGHSKG